MFSLVKNEVIKIFAGKKIYVISVIIILANLLAWMESLVGTIDILINGQNISLHMLGTIMNIIMPIFMIILVGDMFTAEYVNGTLKLPLLHPVSRMKLITAKAIALIIPVFVLTIFSIIISYLLGSIYFGWGDIFIFEDVEYSTIAGIILTINSYLISIIPVYTFSLVLMFLSMFFNSTGAFAGASFGLIILLSFFGEVINALKPYLIIHYFNDLFRIVFFEGDPVNIAIAFVVIPVYGLCSYLLSIYLFRKKDLLY